MNYTSKVLELPKVKQFHNKNQFVISYEKYVVFQSYDSLIARYDYSTGEVEVYEDWDYSNTTRKHFYLFLSDCGFEVNQAKNKRLWVIRQLKVGRLIKCYN